MNIGWIFNLLRHRFGVAVEAALEVGLVLLLEADSAVHGVGGVVLVVSDYESEHFINATRCKHSQGDVALPARISQSHRTHHIHTITHSQSTILPNHILLVELAPIHIRSSRLVITTARRTHQSRSIHHVIGLDSVQFGTHVLRVLQSGFRLVHGEPSVAELLDHHSADPTILTKHKKRLLPLHSPLARTTITDTQKQSQQTQYLNEVMDDGKRAEFGCLFASSFSSETGDRGKMYGNKYDTDVTVWSPEGKLHQVRVRCEE